MGVGGRGRLGEPCAVEREKDGMLTVYRMVLMGDNTAGGAISADEERESGPIRRQSQASADRKHNNTQSPQLSTPRLPSEQRVASPLSVHSPIVKRSPSPAVRADCPTWLASRACPVAHQAWAAGIATTLSVDGETGY